MRNAILLFLLTAATLGAADGQENAPWRVWITRAAAEHHAGALAAAVESGKRALAVAREAGESDLHLAIIHSVLGSAYRDWGRCADAHGSYVNAVALFEKQPEQYHRYVFNSIANLIDTASECGQFDLAEKSYRSHRRELEQFRSGPVDDATLLAIQGSIARGRKRYPEAEDYFRRALQAMEGVSNRKPSDVAEIRSSMALMIYHQGRFEESLEESELAIADLERVNPRSVWLPAALNNSACVLAELGRMDESRQMYQRALALARDLFGEDSRNTAQIMLNYAALLQKQKHSSEAGELKKKGLEVYQRSLVRDSQTVHVLDLKKK